MAALREIGVLLALSHECIVTVREMVVGDSFDKVFMVMEVCMWKAKRPPFALCLQFFILIIPLINLVHGNGFTGRYEEIQCIALPAIRIEANALSNTFRNKPHS